MTWREIKLAALQKMFSADGSEIPTDTGTTDYLAAMPHAANEALQRLCTVGKFYRKCYETVLDGTVRKIDLKTDITDYYDFGNNLEIYLFDANGLPEPLDGCRVVAARYLILPDGLTGTLQFYYNAWPEKITEATLDTYELPLDPEVVVLIPKYIASQLYTDSEAEVAARYYNEFEIGLSALKNATVGIAGGDFVSLTGWC